MLSGDSYLISTSITRIVGGGTGLKSGKHFGSESDTVRAVLCAWIEKSQVVTIQMQYCESTLTLNIFWKLLDARAREFEGAPDAMALLALARDTWAEGHCEQARAYLSK